MKEKKMASILWTLLLLLTGPSQQQKFNCSDVQADVVLLVDGSYSIGLANFAKLRAFIKVLVNSFDIGPDKVQISLVQYSRDPHIEFTLNKHHNITSVVKAVQTFPYRGGSTNTGRAMTHVREKIIVSGQGARPNVPRVMVLITDGKSSDSFKDPATKLRESDVEIFAVGVKDAVRSELRAIANQPSDTHVYGVEDFDAFERISKELTQSICLGIEQELLNIKKKSVIYSSVGGTATLPCDGVGASNCSTVEWYNGLYGGPWRKIGPDVPPERAERLSLLPDCSLHITNITTEDDGEYRCRIPLSGRRKDFRLFVLDGVIYSSVGGTATLPGDGVGGPNCSSVEWYDGPYDRPYGGGLREIWPDVPPKRAERLSLLPDCSLHITNITTEDAGRYTCENPRSGRSEDFLLILLDGVIYSSVGGTATLPYDGVRGSNCSSVEWFDGYRSEIWPDVPPERTERLSLLSDCSLHITNITTEDAGHYRSYNPLRRQRQEFLLILLDVPSSPSESEAESEDHVTLPCVLHTGIDCDLLTVYPDFNLSWVEVEGTNLWTSTNYQIRKTSACSTTLTVNLTSPSPYSQRRCQVTTGGQMQVSSALYIFGSFLADVYMVVRVAIVLFLTVCAITFEIIWRRRNSQ